jgi:hypothetical protein
LEENGAAFLLLPILVMHHFLFTNFGYFERINLCVAKDVEVGCKKPKRN